MHIEWRIKIPLHVSSSYATADRKKEGTSTRWMSRGKVRQEEEGKKNPPRFVAMPSPSSFLHPRKRCSIKDNGNWKDNRTSSPCGSLSLPNAHTFAHTRETHRIEIQSGCRISDAFVVHVVGRRRRHNFRFVDENSNAEFPARFHDPTPHNHHTTTVGELANHRINYRRVVESLSIFLLLDQPWKIGFSLGKSIF